MQCARPGFFSFQYTEVGKRIYRRRDSEYTSIWQNPLGIEAPLDELDKVDLFVGYVCNSNADELDAWATGAPGGVAI
jgi:hypothetical protein